MAHQIDMSNDRANTAYTGLVGWHGLGRALPPDADLATWRVAAGMDWTVKASQLLYTAEATGSVPLAFDAKKVLYRSDTSAPLSVVSEGYNIVQPGEVLDFFSRLIASHGYKMETAGCLYGGKKFWALARTGKTVRINGQDEIAPYLLMATSCDGSMASCAHPTGVRVVCDNTLRMAIGPDAKLARIRVPHSVAFDADAVHAEMGLMEGAWENFLGNIKRMTATKIGRAEAIQIVADELKDEWLDDDGAKMDEASMLESSKLLRRVFALFDGEGLGSEWDGSKGTAWGLMNAVTQYCDHETGSSRTDGSTAFERAHLGDRADFKTRIANKLLEIA